MFHRVLPANECAEVEADPLYTITTELFSEILGYLSKNYHLVSLADVLASREGLRPLPPYAALVTFDDGWQDNLQHAMPILQAANVPWALFVAKNAANEPQSWWQETLSWALRTGRTNYDELWQMAGDDSQHDSNKKNELELLVRYGFLAPDRRDAVLQKFSNELQQKYNAPQMLSTADLTTLQGNHVAIGVHGDSHLPLTRLDDPEQDIRSATLWLQEILQGKEVQAMSFPHGRYNACVAAEVRSVGYRLLFTSDKILNSCPKGWLQSDLLGRISLTIHDIGDAHGQLARHKIASWLVLRDHQ
jgi:peptidoglycan/xylan/chitin deacetylase (PgdA/CDA1 family)